MIQIRHCISSAIPVFVFDLLEFINLVSHCCHLLCLIICFQCIYSVCAQSSHMPTTLFFFFYPKCLLAERKPLVKRLLFYVWTRSLILRCHLPESFSVFLRDMLHPNTSIDKIKTQCWRGMSYSRWCASVCHVSQQILLREAG